MFVFLYAAQIHTVPESESVLVFGHTTNPIFGPISPIHEYSGQLARPSKKSLHKSIGRDLDCEPNFFADGVPSLKSGLDMSRRGFGYTSAAVRETDLLHHIYRTCKSNDKRVLLGPGDDMAMVKLSSGRLLAAVDQLVAGRHFSMENTPVDLIARKAVARNLSDVAAMAAQPVASLAAVTLPPDFGDQNARELFDSVRSYAESFRCPLIGGDIAFHEDASYPLSFTVAILAEPDESGGPVTRSGAKVGDTVYVTGELGGSLKPDGLGKHLTFEPRVNEAIELLSALGAQLHAMIDISDGLGRDASHIAESSGVQISIDSEKLPCSADCDWRNALADGEDYELCFAASGNVLSSLGMLPITAVGEVLSRQNGDERLVLVQHAGEILTGDELGWQHVST